jgi:hypothetical protein
MGLIYLVASVATSIKEDEEWWQADIPTTIDKLDLKQHHQEQNGNGLGHV